MDTEVWPQQFEDILRPFLPYLYDDQSLTPDLDLRDLGLDSLAAVGVMVALEEGFGITIPDEAFDDATVSTPASLWTTVRKLVETRAEHGE
ncbi:phosphopantetheine-binding protein [Kitasatospora viridis]|uniref:Acyl carrier protein n=1 Tax=Kitasatospora viridis TaxID=281105 RepID=A0A561UAD1_9ACTN|nr:phosphopantetheine-binding protein [Kitasatospora viridis]TWF96312.1 acyl carrier protein [Kitasatospora viridis]